MSIYQLDDDMPQVHPSAFVADSAQVMGRVSLAEDTSVSGSAPLPVKVLPFSFHGLARSGPKRGSSAAMSGRLGLIFQVLGAPPPQGFNWLAYLLPVLGIGLGIVLAWLTVRTWLTHRAPETPPEIPREYAERLEKELKEF